MIIEMLRRPRPKAKCKNSLEVTRQLQEILSEMRDIKLAQTRMLTKMSQEFDNLKVAVANAVDAITEAIDRIVNSDNPDAIQAEADKLSGAVDALNAALNPVVPEPQPEPTPEA